MTTNYPGKPPAKEEAIMKNCMQSTTYDECKLSECRQCGAKKYCSRENWTALGGR